MRAMSATAMLIGLTTALTACDSRRPELGAIPRGTTDPIDPPYTGQQGVHLEGGATEGQRLAFDFASARDANGPCQVTLDQTALLATCRTSQEIVGVTFSTTDGMNEATISSHSTHPDPHAPGVDLDHYRVTLNHGGDLCARAMPIQGSWTSDGMHVPDSTRFTFACSDGVMYKCIDFGFHPWEIPPGPTIAGYPPPIDGVDSHQACTRMARADYCADGRTHTMDGTTVHYYDIFNRPDLDLVATDRMPVVRHDSSLDPTLDMYFEAAWRPGRPAPKRESAAICLSKLRWSTIPLETGGPCPELLPDPRQDELAHFCEDLDEMTMQPFYSETILEDMTARLFNDSAFIDLGLYRWLPGPDNYTTTHFRDFGFRTDQTDIPPDFRPTAQARFEGAVFNHATRYIPLGLIGLCSYLGVDGGLAGIYLTTTGNIPDCTSEINCCPPPPHFALISLEGKVYNPATPWLIPSTAVPLYLYDNGGGYSITTTDDTLPLPRNLIGYLPH